MYYKNECCVNILTFTLFRRLQAIQNATARLITGVQRKDHITPILQQLHWLPVREQVIFKHTLLVFKAVHGLLPPYLADNCQLLADTGRRTHSSLGDRCFAVAGPSDLALVVLKLLVVRVYLQCKVALAVGSVC